MRRHWILLNGSLLCGLLGCSGPHLEHADSPMTSSVTPFLLFQDGRAEDAMQYYVAAFPDGYVIDVKRHGPDGAGPEGTVELGRFEILGQEVRCTDSPPVHEFDFTPSMSLFVDCSTEDELVALVDRLSDGGEFFMPLDNYGFSQKFAFFKDRFGVSWQVNLPYETTSTSSH